MFFFSIWGAGAPWERPPTDYLNSRATARAPSKHKVGWDEAATKIAKADEAANKLLGKRQR